MKIQTLGLNQRSALTPGGLQSVNSWRNVLGLIRESFTGAWQQSVIIDRSPTTLLAFSAVYCCVTGISSDIAKMRIKLTQNNDGIWDEIVDAHGNANNAWILKLLRKPNDYQNRIQFVTCWILSKLLYGNAYVLKQRDPKNRDIITALYILHPLYVIPLVSESGSVYYSIGLDYLNEQNEGKTIPASEIIHDRMPELWHPLIGVSPLYACAMSVTMGNKIQSNSTAHAGNASRPGGIVTVPGEINDDTALRLKTAWETNYGGPNSGRVAILSDGMTFNAVHETAEQSQLIDQLKWTVEDVGRSFHYPAFKMGGPIPPNTTIELLTIAYYTDCLQSLIESMEVCLDEGLGLPVDVGTELDIDALMRMDTVALFDSINKASDWMKLNEQRRRANLPKLSVGGDTVYKQQQDHSIEALAKRDAKDDPFSTTGSAPAPAPPPAAREADPEFIKTSVREEVANVVAALPPAKDGLPGKDADPEAIRSLILTEVERAVSVVSIPENAPGLDEEDQVALWESELDKELVNA